MALHNPLRRETGRVKVAVNIAGEDEAAQPTAFAPTPQNLEAGMRRGGAIEVQAMPEKSPGLLRVTAEPDGIGHFLEPPAAKGRVRPPKALGTAKVGQSRIDSHACAGPDQ